MRNSSIRVLFMGTPEFAVYSLQSIVESGMQVVGVVTAQDKPAGRGKKLQSPAVKQYADQHLECPVFQPSNLKDPAFAEELRALNADLFIVVAFRMLPESIWSIPRKGTINLHASLLPHYRGAAPINWAIINGETETGVTTFFIDHEIDTGKILLQDKAAILPEDNAGTLHDKLMVTGAELLVRTIREVMFHRITPVEQKTLGPDGQALKKAPRIYKEDCRIPWEKSMIEIHNMVRGLNPYPGAFTHLEGPDFSEPVQLKIFETRITDLPSSGYEPGSMMSDGKNYLQVATGNGMLEILDLQAAGKRRMSIGDYLRGIQFDPANCILV